MIEPSMVKKLDFEVERLKRKYPPINIQTLDTLAREEFDANVVRTPLGWMSKVVKSESGLFIFYYGSFKPYESLALAHEIGHIVAGHLDGYNPGLEIKEREADYFSAQINDVSLSKLNSFRFMEAVFRFKDDFRNIFRYGVEIAKLVEQDAYEAFKEV